MCLLDAKDFLQNLKFDRFRGDKGVDIFTQIAIMQSDILVEKVKVVRIVKIT